MDHSLNSTVLFDFARASRVGLPEAIFCQGKPLPVLRELLEQFSNRELPILFTRLSSGVFAEMPTEIQRCYDYDPVSETAFAAIMPTQTTGSVAVISAGAADAKVAREAARTLEYLNIRYSLFEDCGVAGLWRLVEKLPQIATHNAIIAVAGMEGALASVIGGLSPLPIFAVPTSIGYGVSANGQAALSGMLASCAPGIATLNIDNGYGAACAAARVINQLSISIPTINPEV